MGDHADPASDYIQFDPSALARDGDLSSIPVRVSRTRPRTSKEGIVFRSFESVVAVDCKRRTARFLQASFYAEPDFKGTPFRTEVFDAADIRPMAFRLIKGAPTRRVIDAACNTTAIRSL